MKGHVRPIVALCLIGLVLMACTQDDPGGENYELPAASAHADTRDAAGNLLQLSSWALMKVSNDQLILADDVISYKLNSTLFTDYAHKLRTLRLPAGQMATVNNDGTLNFPVGTVISKTFYYPTISESRDTGLAGKLLKTTDSGQYFHSDLGQQGGLDLVKVHLIETRLLVLKADGWMALPYVWNAEQSDATLSIIGDLQSLSLADKDGEVTTFAYLVPDKNQCAGCHTPEHNTRQLKPIGPRVRHLDRMVQVAQGNQNQLDYWQSLGLLQQDDLDLVSTRIANWRNSDEPIEARARAYLDINCGHCHSEVGAADTSGLFLDITVTDPLRLGRCKSPIAAGQGTGGNQHSIVPEHPEQSILVYRMNSLDPGAMMPEVGRSLVHAEGVELVSAWIRQMEGSCDTVL